MHFSLDPNKCSLIDLLLKTYNLNKLASNFRLTEELEVDIPPAYASSSSHNTILAVMSRRIKTGDRHIAFTKNLERLITICRVLPGRLTLFKMNVHFGPSAGWEVGLPHSTSFLEVLRKFWNCLTEDRVIENAILNFLEFSTKLDDDAVFKANLKLDLLQDSISELKVTVNELFTCLQPMPRLRHLCLNTYETFERYRPLNWMQPENFQLKTLCLKGFKLELPVSLPISDKLTALSIHSCDGKQCMMTLAFFTFPNLLHLQLYAIDADCEPVLNQGPIISNKLRSLQILSYIFDRRLIRKVASECLQLQKLRIADYSNSSTIPPLIESGRSKSWGILAPAQTDPGASLRPWVQYLRALPATEVQVICFEDWNERRPEHYEWTWELRRLASLPAVGCGGNYTLIRKQHGHLMRVCTTDGDEVEALGGSSDARYWMLKASCDWPQFGEILK